MNQPAPLDYQRANAVCHPILLGLRLSSIGILAGVICAMLYLRTIHWPTDLLAKYGLTAGLLALGFLVCLRFIAKSELDPLLTGLAFVAILLGVYYGCFAPRYIIKCEPGLRNAATDGQEAAANPAEGSEDRPLSRELICVSVISAVRPLFRFFYLSLTSSPLRLIAHTMRTK